MGKPNNFSWIDSFIDVVKAAVPTILSMIFFQMVQILNVYFIGHLGEPDLLAGVGLGNMLLNVCVFAFSQGMNGTIETFVGWSYGDADYGKCGIHLNRARTIIFILMLPSIVLFMYIDKILIMLD